jgi:hypothetical protein
MPILPISVDLDKGTPVFYRHTETVITNWHELAIKPGNPGTKVKNVSWPLTDPIAAPAETNYTRYCYLKVERAGNLVPRSAPYHVIFVKLVNYRAEKNLALAVVNDERWGVNLGWIVESCNVATNPSYQAIPMLNHVAKEFGRKLLNNWNEFKTWDRTLRSSPVFTSSIQHDFELTMGCSYKVFKRNIEDCWMLESEAVPTGIVKEFEEV